VSIEHIISIGRGDKKLYSPMPEEAPVISIEVVMEYILLSDALTIIAEKIRPPPMNKKRYPICKVSRFERVSWQLSNPLFT